MRSFLRDENAVSEVLGYILSFAILSAVLLVSMLAFNSARAQAEDRVRGIEASSVAHRIAAAIVEVQAFVDGRASGTTTNEIRLILDLPESFENHGYTIGVCDTDAKNSCVQTPCQANSKICKVVVTSGSVKEGEPLLGVTAKSSTLSGGPVAVCYVVTVTAASCSQQTGISLVTA